MDDFISRDDFIKKKRKLYCENCSRRKDSKGKTVYEIGDAPCRSCGIGNVLDDLDDFPAADVRPVVACCDCKHFQINVSPSGYLPQGVPEWECRYWCRPTDPTGFCSYGEKRELMMYGGEYVYTQAEINRAPTVIPADPSEEQREYEAAVESAQNCELYEPTYDPDTGAL